MIGQAMGTCFYTISGVDMILFRSKIFKKHATQHTVGFIKYSDQTGYGHSLLHNRLCIYESVQIKNFQNMQHKILWTLFNAKIGQSMGTRFYTISCVIWHAIYTRSYTISCVYMNLSRLKIFNKHATQHIVDFI